MKKLKIVMISTLWENTPPPKYGGTERVVHYLTEELVKRGHDVTLFATGESKTKAKLVSVFPKPLYRIGIPWSNPYWPLINIGKALEYAKKTQADIVHNHSQHLGYPFGPISPVPMVHTHHGNIHFKLTGKEKHALMRAFKDNNYISISNSQRAPMPDLNWVATVYNGIPVEEFEFNIKPKKYLAWMGRFTAAKGPHLAIQIAKRLKMPLVMAAKIEKENQRDLQYYQQKIKPQIDGKQIRYLGEVSNRLKNQIYKNAFCLINPILWDEPFGLVPMEANACGTPVVTFARGAMPELIKNGENGFAVQPNNINAMIKAVKKILNMKEDEYKKMRENCRKHVSQNFSIKNMVDGYEKVYYEVLAKKS